MAGGPLRLPQAPQDSDALISVLLFPDPCSLKCETQDTRQMDCKGRGGAGCRTGGRQFCFRPGWCAWSASL